MYKANEVKGFVTKWLKEDGKSSYEVMFTLAAEVAKRHDWQDSDLVYNASYDKCGEGAKFFVDACKARYGRSTKNNVDRFRLGARPQVREQITDVMKSANGVADDYPELKKNAVQEAFVRGAIRGEKLTAIAKAQRAKGEAAKKPRKAKKYTAVTVRKEIGEAALAKAKHFYDVDKTATKQIVKLMESAWEEAVKQIGLEAKPKK